MSSPIPRGMVEKSWRLGADPKSFTVPIKNVIMPDPNAGDTAVLAAVVAGLVSGGVALVTVFLEGRRSRIERQRDLLGQAYGTAVRYREFAFRIRRRVDSPEAAERLATELSTVQEELAGYKAVLRVECSYLAETYDELVAETKRIAGGHIKRAWRVAPVRLGEDMDVSDIDYSGLDSVDSAYLIAAQEHLALGTFFVGVETVASCAQTKNVVAGGWSSSSTSG